ncbi:MAG: hypothetical protein ACXAEU_06260 [Candidatus Hodarchaeales archaeon]
MKVRQTRNNKHLLIALMLIFIAFFQQINVQESVGHSTTSSIISRIVKVDYDGNHGVAYSFYASVPMEWNSSLPVPIEYDSHLHDETFNATYRSILHVEFYDKNGKLVYQGKKILESFTNLGYQFLDQFNVITWNLSAAVTSIPPGGEWYGLVFLNVSLATVLGDNSSISNKMIITYRYIEVSGIGGFLFFPVLVTIVVITYYNKQKPKYKH